MRSRFDIFRNFQTKGRLAYHYPKSCGYVTSKMKTYDDAINLLNNCQRPYEIIVAHREASIKSLPLQNENLKACLTYLGYTLSDLDRINIVHVTGTKGKGSTCAYVDSILNSYRKSHKIPLNIGLFTSPHLISVRERIKINSISISPEKFTKYFFEVWDRLQQPLEKKCDTSFPKIPGYFRFLTLMSYHVFLQEGVDTAIYEVGIGGEYDSTNIVENPIVTGISKVGIDHTHILGEKITDIAWQKAGILKKDCPSYCIDQEPDVLTVVNNRAEERQVKYSKIVTTLPQLNDVVISPNAEFQKQNATLAIYLADIALKKLAKDYDYTVSDSNPLPIEFVDGLEKVIWKGRCQRIEEEKLIWYIDGAHNRDSIKVATAWLAKELSSKIPNDKPKNGLRILLFNQQGHRDVMSVLEDLYRESELNRIQFDHVIFCPTVPEEPETKKELINLSVNKKTIKELTLQKQFADKWKSYDKNGAIIHICRSLERAIDLSRLLSQNDSGKSHVFLTGSIHLVGRALGILEGADSL